MQIDNIAEQTLKDILVRESYVTAFQMKEAEEAARSKRISLVDHLIEQGITSKDLIGQAVAEALKVPYADLNSLQPPREQVLKIPEDVAKQNRVVLFSDEDKSVTVATDDPEQEGLSDLIALIFPEKSITVAYSVPEDIEANFVHYQKPLDTRFSKILAESEQAAPKILDEIFSDAKVYKASDIHFEPRRTEVIVRFRVDGVLHDAGRLPKEHYDNILNRIKVQSHLRIDEHFSAQDGSMHYEHRNLKFDLRTSVIPTVEGEKVALRVLAAYVEGLTLSDLGLSQSDRDILEEASIKPFGMILVTGPTGAGKTTTLYAVLKLLNKPEVNITTIEDPVEYKIVGVNQIQVNEQTNLTFAEGLRSIVRQDPDIILVGEIRDKETAEIAVNAALTGHLLLSTFHANDAATAIPRLFDMGVEPFLLASTVELIISQRLIRKICETCRYSIDFTPKELTTGFKAVSSYFRGKKTTLYRGKGCDACSQTGFTGRTAIFELIKVNKETEDLMLRNPSSQQIIDMARSTGARTLFEDGVEKVLAGVTTLEELMRVARPPE